MLRHQHIDQLAAKFQPLFYQMPHHDDQPMCSAGSTKRNQRRYPLCRHHALQVHYILDKRHLPNHLPHLAEMNPLVLDQGRQHLVVQQVIDPPVLEPHHTFHNE